MIERSMSHPLYRLHFSFTRLIIITLPRPYFASQSFIAHQHHASKYKKMDILRNRFDLADATHRTYCTRLY